MSRASQAWASPERAGADAVHHLAGGAAGGAAAGAGVEFEGSGGRAAAQTSGREDIKKTFSNFTAIAVGQGDAFFLRRGDFTVLVDGGRSERGFPAQFRAATGRASVEVLVCTHNDRDHASGLIGFLEGGLNCREVWLPASWTDRLEDLLLHPGEFAGELVDNVAALWERPGSPRGTHRAAILEVIGDILSEPSSEPDQRGPVEDGNLDLARETSHWEELQVWIPTMLEQAQTVPGVGHSPFGRGTSWPANLSERDRSSMFVWQLDALWRLDLLSQAISAGDRIRRLALTAYQAGAKMRWFEFKERASHGGNPGCLLPLNAREVAHVAPRRLSSLAFLALTKCNKESLVFLSPDRKDAPAVLFTADSDLKRTAPIPWNADMVITAPHHGSEANAHAYCRFAGEADSDADVVWVRSDGNFRRRPGPSYLAAPGIRFCTLCRCAGASKQHVRLTGCHGTWNPGTKPACQCV